MNKKYISIIFSSILFLLYFITAIYIKSIIIVPLLISIIIIIVKNILFIKKGESNYYNLDKFYKLNIYFSIISSVILISVVISAKCLLEKFTNTYAIRIDYDNIKDIYFVDLFIIVFIISMLLNIYLIVLKKRKIKVKKNKNIEKVSN